jgi:hypothetical protein
MSHPSIYRLLTSVVLVFFISVSSVGAQAPAGLPAEAPAPDSQVATTQQTPLTLPTLTKDDFFTKNWAHQLLSDQKSIWTSPAHIKKSDAKWLLPLAGATAVMIAKDNQISHEFDNRESLQNFGLKVSTVGAYTPYAVPGAFLALGKMTGNDRLADTGKKGFEATLYTTIAMQGLKVIANRTRPYKGGDGGFFNGGNSFPSGHAMQAWALAKVVSDEYSDKPLVKVGMYSFATAVSLARLTSQRHYASDVLVGSAMGYLIGKFIMRNHETAVGAVYDRSSETH